MNVVKTAIKLYLQWHRKRLKHIMTYLNMKIACSIMYLPCKYTEDIQNIYVTICIF